MLPDRPPYVEPSERHKVHFFGSCFCKTIRFEVFCSCPLDAKFCHCTTCQRLHGAPFQWAAIINKSDMHFTQGKEHLAFYNSARQSQEYLLPCKVSCAKCRTPILDEGRTMLLIFPTCIDFETGEERKRWNATCHIFYSQRSMDITDELPKWSKHKDESDIITEEKSHAL